ncbi:MAG: pyrroloquinoline quinone (PQQ) biosynthesis protein C [Gammaproteobacteria bacterium]|jgi:pyrroloquinoline quinone (PQQ) biosynthesis protein C
MSNKPGPDEILDYIAKESLAAARHWPWVVAPLTRATGRAYILQHVLRNRFFSSVMRPAWMSRCPDLAIVRKTISQMHEELVLDPAIGAAHTKILFEMGRNTGLTDDQMNNVVAETSTAASFAIQEKLARQSHWTVGWLGSSIDEFVLTQLPGHNFEPRHWQDAFGLSIEQVFFFDYHLKADLEHAGTSSWSMMQPHVTQAVCTEIVETLPLILESHRLFYVGVEAHTARMIEA